MQGGNSIGLHTYHSLGARTVQLRQSMREILAFLDEHTFQPKDDEGGCIVLETKEEEEGKGNW